MLAQPTVDEGFRKFICYSCCGYNKGDQTKSNNIITATSKADTWKLQSTDMRNARSYHVQVQQANVKMPYLKQKKSPLKHAQTPGGRTSSRSKHQHEPKAKQHTCKSTISMGIEMINQICQGMSKHTSSTDERHEDVIPDYSSEVLSVEGVIQRGWFYRSAVLGIFIDSKNIG